MDSQKSTYIYEIPYFKRKELCRILDFNDSWKDLGGSMNYSVFDIQEIDNDSRRNRESPSNILLTKWGHLNHTVDELFVLLFKMKHVPAMKCMKTLVHQKFHKLLNLCIDSNANSICKDANEHCVTSDSNTTSSPEQCQDRATNAVHSRSSNNVPLVIKFIEEGVRIESSNKILNGPPAASESSSDRSTSVSGGSTNCLLDSASAIPKIPYEDLAKATNNWHPSNILGKGGFGVVFKGDWKHTVVAIKRLKPAVGLEGESLRELNHLNSCRHDNVLPLYGYSVDGKEPCLVYQLMIGGSLEQRLKCRDGRPALTWKQRLGICKGVAKGLQFLHNAPKPLIHGDIKSANILLDTCGEPRIGDFGLARRGPHQSDDRTHLKVSRVHGTRPYLPDELLRGHRLSTAVDTYSYGVVVFEIATGLAAYDGERTERFLRDYVASHLKAGLDAAALEDFRVKESIESDPELCRKLILLGIRCIPQDPHERLKMVNVWLELMTY